MLGPRGFERSERIADPSGNGTGRRHVGWRWPCDCTAFARTEDEYIWVPCWRHDRGSV